MAAVRFAIVACFSMAVFLGCATMPGPYEVGKSIGPIDFDGEWDWFHDLFIAPLEQLSDDIGTQKTPPSGN